jgi:hypothetical protein
MKTTGFVLISLFVLLSCENKDEREINHYSEYFSEDSIATTGLIFYPVEYFEDFYHTDTAVIKLYFESKEEYGDLNHYLMTTEFYDNEEMIIRFDSIYAPDYVYPMVAPATAKILLPENLTRIIMINGKTTDVYNISITGEKVVMTPVDTFFTFLKFPVTFRYPENTFAYFCHTYDYACDWVKESFYKILSDSLNASEYFFSGTGRIPYLTVHPGIENYYYTRYFKYSEEQEFDKAKTLLNSFQKMLHDTSQCKAQMDLSSWNNR